MRWGCVLTIVGNAVQNTYYHRLLTPSILFLGITDLGIAWGVALD